MTDSTEEELTPERMAEIMLDYNKAEAIFKTFSAQLNGIECGVVLWHTAKILQSIMAYGYDGKWDDLLVPLKLAVEAHDQMGKGKIPPELYQVVKETLN